MTEDQLEQETLGWLCEQGYTHLYGPDIAHDGDNPERESYRDVILTMRLRRSFSSRPPRTIAVRIEGSMSPPAPNGSV